MSSARGSSSPGRFAESDTRLILPTPLLPFLWTPLDPSDRFDIEVLLGISTDWIRGTNGHQSSRENYF